MLGCREALTEIVMREAMPMPIRNVVALADHELDDARVPGRALRPPWGRKDAHEEQLDLPERNAATGQPIVAENLRERPSVAGMVAGRRGAYLATRRQAGLQIRP